MRSDHALIVFVAGAVFLGVLLLIYVVVRRMRKKKTSVVEQKSDPVISQEIKPEKPVYEEVAWGFWKGSLLYFWFLRLRDVLIWNINLNPIMIVRFLSHGGQDQRAVVVDPYSTVEWGDELYDVEPEAIVMNRGKRVMYVFQGIRKPLLLWGYVDILKRMEAVKNKDLSVEEIEKYGKIVLSSCAAFVKHNDKSALEIGRAMQDDKVLWTFYAAVVAAAGVLIIVLMLMGYLPNANTDSVIAIRDFLAKKYGG